ncbi:hypothetical protein [Actinokineospora enzanensis]|uniref:hypothetical protein n=1 Tax=Actinokineospora enzanensis TaxID=155975 RepID=UPI000380D540|nr:hypothetical protein [Actinokineospora enzanensis]
MFRFSTLALALLMSIPSLYAAFVANRLDPTDALIHFLIAVPVAGLLLAIPRAAFQRYSGNRSQAAVAELIQAGAVRTDRPDDRG